MALVRSALRDHDLSRLREAAHKLYDPCLLDHRGGRGSDDRRRGHREDLDSCAELVDRLESMCSELLEDTRTLTIDGLSL